MKLNSIVTASVAILAMAFTSSAFSAAYIKFDGVEGESRHSQPLTRQQTTPAIPTAPASTDRIQAEAPQSAALLLPAVQAAREAARRAPAPSQQK